MLPASTLIGRYEVIRELGRGAMGTVFMARDTALGRLVALKTFRAPFAEGADPQDSGVLRRRSLREAQRAGTLSHPSVITIYDVVEIPEDDSFYIVMEYVEGQALDARMRERGPMKLGEVAPLVAQIASALDHLHARGIVHRDVKPGNVLVTPEGRVKITDFGIARSEDPAATLDTDIYGTPYYMAPEQVQGKPVDARTDVFALGVVLYEMLTGTRPFPGSTVAEVAHRIVYGPPAEPEVDGKPLPAAVREVLAQALAKDPDDRFPSAGALAAAVQDLADTTGNLELDATTAFPRKRWLAATGMSRQPLPRTPMVIVAVVGVVVLLLVTGYLYVRSQTSPAPAVNDELQARRVGYVKLMSEAKQLLANGDAEGAVLVFQAAEGMALDPTAARRLREEAQRKAEEQGAHLQLLDARDDLAKGRYDQVVATARKMMATQAGREKAAGVLADVEEALARSERTSRAAPPAGPRQQSASAGTDGGAAAVESEPEPASTAINFGVLTVDFKSDAPEGTLTLWVDGHEVARHPFEYYERTGLFRRRRPAVPGSWRHDLTVWQGNHALRVLLQRADQPGAVKEIEAAIQPGGLHTLAISLPASGAPAVELR